MKKFEGSIYQEIHRVRQHGPREPLRTLGEMAEEFGVSKGQLQAFIQHRNGPKPVMKHWGNVAASKATWYRPSEMRSWWAEAGKC